MEGKGPLLKIINEIKEAGNHARINTHQCEFLKCVVCSLEGGCVRVWIKDFDLELKGRPHIVQELVHVLQKCLGLVQSYARDDWLRKVFISRANAAEFEGIVEELCKCTDLINEGIVYDTRFMKKGAWIRTTKQNAMDSATFYKEGLKFNARQDIKVLKSRTNSKSIPTSAKVLDFLQSRFEEQDQKQHAFVLERDLYRFEYDDLEFHGKLGSGAYGVVNEVTWLGMSLAAKGTHEIELEAAAMIMLQCPHPNVVQVIGYCVHGDSKWLILEKVRTSLKELIKHASVGCSPFPHLTSIELMLQTAKGMHHLHARNVIHRDLKPGNILVNFEGSKFSDDKCFSAKVADFGASKPEFQSGKDLHSYLTGTPKYMAPEMFGNEGISEGFYRKKVDIYSYGITCSEILTGEEPFCERAMREVKDMVRRGIRPELPRECPQSLRNLIVQCWDDDPDVRPGFEDIIKRLWCVKSELLLKEAYGKPSLVPPSEPGLSSCLSNDRDEQGASLWRLRSVFSSRDISVICISFAFLVIIISIC